jgi:hypothetical protein
MNVRNDLLSLFFEMRFYAFLLLLSSVICQAQSENFWHTLAQVNFVTTKDKNGFDAELPVFSQYLKSFHQKKVTLKGYVIPLEEVGGSGKFMLSSLPFNLCYFCGAAGPETVVEVETIEKVKFSTKQIHMDGILILNDKDPDHHIYILKNARLLN